MGNPGYARTHERLTKGIYIYNMATKLHELIRHCPHCRLNQTPWHKPYGSMQPIITPARPFHILTIDFILALPVSAPEGFECVMSVTDKFSKAVTFIPGKNTWSRQDWAVVLMGRLALLNWGLPKAIISDRDRKFVGQLWKQIFSAMKVSLLYSTAYHPQTDGMSERTNQTAEIALRYYLATLEDIRQWPAVIDRMSASLNNSTKYSSTSRTPTHVMYGFKTREALDLLRIEDPDAAVSCSNDVLVSPAHPNDPPVRPAVMDEYRPTHIDAKDAIAFAAMMMKDYYDGKHTPISFNVDDMVNLRLHRGYKVPAVTSKKVGQQLVGPFPVIERIGRLAYRLRLPANMMIHDVISVAHLEPATDPADDPYQRRRPAIPLIVDGQEEYEIDRLVNKRPIRRGRGWSTQYLVRWKNCGLEEDMWLPERELGNASGLVNEYEERYGTAAGIEDVA